MTAITPELILKWDVWAQANGFGLESDKWARDHQKDTRCALQRIKNLGWAPDYAELGYSSPRTAILFYDWNNVSRAAMDLLESHGYECEWEDEWTTCGNCGKALRTTADSYSWQPSYLWESDCEIVCRDCADIPAVLERLEDNPRQALNDHINPADYGYVCLEKNFENGFHPGQNDDPRAIYKRLHEQGRRRLLFSIDEASQFYITFSIWEYKGEEA